MFIKAIVMVLMATTTVAGHLVAQISPAPRPTPVPTPAIPVDGPWDRSKRDSAAAVPNIQPMLRGMTTSTARGALSASEMMLYVPLIPPFEGTLRPRHGQMLRVTIGTDRQLLIQGTCDFPCVDFDLEWVNDDGQVLAADNAGDNTPRLEIRDGHPRHLNIRVFMNRCAAANCTYNLNYYRTR